MATDASQRICRRKSAKAEMQCGKGMQWMHSYSIGRLETKACACFGLQHAVTLLYCNLGSFSCHFSCPDKLNRGQR